MKHSPFHLHIQEREGLPAGDRRSPRHTRSDFRTHAKKGDAQSAFQVGITANEQCWTMGRFESLIRSPPPSPPGKREKIYLR